MMKTLLLDDHSSQAWIESLRKAVANLNGELVVVNVMMKEKIRWSDYDLVVLEAGSIHDLVATIEEIQKGSPHSQVVVFSPVPQYKQAVEVILAGAADYYRQTHDVETLSEILRKALVSGRSAANRTRKRREP